MSPGPIPQHVLVARFIKLADELHASGRQATEMRSYVSGVERRVAANAIRRELDMAPLTYDGREPSTGTRLADDDWRPRR